MLGFFLSFRSAALTQGLRKSQRLQILISRVPRYEATLSNDAVIEILVPIVKDSRIAVYGWLIITPNVYHDCGGFTNYSVWDNLPSVQVGPQY